MAQTFEGAPFLNPGERPAFIPDIHFLFDRLVSTVPVMGQVDLIDHESATISHEVMVTDHDMLASAGFEPTVSEVYISVDDASLEPSDADEHRVTVIYQYQGTQGEEEIQHALIFAQTRPTNEDASLFRNDEGDFTFERLYVSPHKDASALIDSSEIQVREVEQLSGLLTALETQLAQNLFA